MYENKALKKKNLAKLSQSFKRVYIYIYKKKACRYVCDAICLRDKNKAR